MTDRALRERLAGLREEAANEEFLAALRLRLSEEEPPAVSMPWGERAREALGRWRTLAWPLAGALAGVATFAVLTLVTEHPVAAPSPAASPPAAPVPALASGDVSPRYLVPASKVAVIRLTFNASVAVEGASFDVTLPQGLSFWSEGVRLADRTARWQDDLDAGDNIVPIAVRADRPGRYRITARVDADGETIEHEIILEAEGPS